MRRRKIVGVSIAALIVGSAGCAGDDTKSESHNDAANGVDSGQDSFAPDTFVPDTTVADSTIVDTTDTNVAETTSDVVDTAEADGARCPPGQWFDFELGA